MKWDEEKWWSGWFLHCEIRAGGCGFGAWAPTFARQSGALDASLSHDNGRSGLIWQALLPLSGAGMRTKISSKGKFLISEWSHGTADARMEVDEQRELRHFLSKRVAACIRQYPRTHKLAKHLFSTADKTSRFLKAHKFMFAPGMLVVLTSSTPPLDFFDNLPSAENG